MWKELVSLWSFKEKVNYDFVPTLFVFDNISSGMQDLMNLDENSPGIIMLHLGVTKPWGLMILGMILYGRDHFKKLCNDIILLPK